MTKLKCLNCKHEFKVAGERAYSKCPKCDGDAYFLASSLHDNSPQKVVQRPEKGTERWYNEKWYRRSDKDWHEDIQRRVQNPDGSITRR